MLTRTRTEFICVVCTFVLLSATPAAIADEGAAIVNGTVITQKTLNLEVEHARKQMQQGETPQADIDDETLRQNVLDNLIAEELLFQESRELGITIEEPAVAQEIEKMKARFPDDEAYQKALAASQMSEDQLHERIQRRMAIRQLVDEQIVAKIRVPEEERRAFYDDHPDFFQHPEQVKASHILIQVEASAEESQKASARQKIAWIQQKLNDGEDFAEMARQHSEGPSKTNGGDLGYFGRGRMAKPFEEAAFALKVGDVSDIVETRFGYHLIKVTDRRDEGLLPFAEVEAQIGQYLKQQQTPPAIQEHIQNLRQTASVEVLL
jgi:peptidyl-prolyl cis-trans isomerase C